jgi:hypothetical protein
MKPNAPCRIEVQEEQEVWHVQGWGFESNAHFGRDGNSGIRGNRVSVLR